MNKSYFDYNDGSNVLPPNAFRISPSQIYKFFDSTTDWWREHYLKESAKFQGSTSSVLGTCIHAAAAMYTDTKAVDTAAIAEYVESIQDSGIDKELILSQYKPMATTLINQFLNHTRITHNEHFIAHNICNDIYVAGSIDAYDELSATLFDYKSMGSLDTARVPTSFPRAYYFQQMAYAYVLRKLGLPVDFVKLVYVSRNNVGRVSEKTGKLLQDYPSTVHVISEQVTEEHMDLIENVLLLIAKSVEYAKRHPENLYLLAQDWRLRPAAETVPHRLFKTATPT